MAQIDTGAKRAGRRAEDLEIVKRRAFIVTDDDGGALEIFRQYLAYYASAPAYQGIMIDLGYRDEIETVRAGYAVRDRARITAAIDDAMVRRLFAFGDRAGCQSMVDREFSAGIDTIVVSPQPTDAAAFAQTAEALIPARS